MFTVNVSDQVATIVMQSPPVNALSEDWVADFLRIIDELAERQRLESVACAFRSEGILRRRRS